MEIISINYTESSSTPNYTIVSVEGQGYIVPDSLYTPVQLAIMPSSDLNLNSLQKVGSVLPLALVKESKITDIDSKTQELINNGFTFDGQIFSMSLTAQINWSNFPQLPDVMFPLSVMTKEDTAYILSLANKMNFYYSALAYKNQYLQSGGVLKGEVMACNTYDCVNAIIDNRT